MNGHALPSDVQAPVTTEASAGSMGLRGLWALVGNSTAMCLVAVIAFLCLFQLQRMHEESIGTLRELHVQERQFNLQALGQLRDVVDKNTGAIDTLAREIRNLNHKEHKGHQE
jgi:hypothetical protein